MNAREKKKQEVTYILWGQKNFKKIFFFEKYKYGKTRQANKNLLIYGI
jgi:hypothetical protein